MPDQPLKSRAELMTVEHTWWIDRNGVTMLVLHPAFPVPANWQNRQEAVVVVRPDGHQIQATAELAMTHLNIPDPNVPIEERWRVTMWLTDRRGDEVPSGSKILVAQEVRDALLPRG